MSTEAKVAITTLPALMTVSPEWAAAMAFGMVGGVLARAGLSYQAEKKPEEIKRELVVSGLIFMGSLLATVSFATLFQANELGVAGIGFAVTFAGTDALGIFKRFIFAPIIGAIRSMGDERNNT